MGLMPPHVWVDSFSWSRLFFNFLAELQSMWDLSFLTRDQTRAPCTEVSAES